MKYLFILVLLIPSLLFCQEKTEKRKKVQSRQSVPVQQVEFTNKGTIKFPDGTEQKTAYPVNSQQSGSVDPNFESTSNGGIRFPDGSVQTTAYTDRNITATNTPGIYVLIDGIQDSIKVLSVDENISIFKPMDPDSIDTRDPYYPQFSYATFIKPMDHLSATLRGLVWGSEISRVEIIVIDSINGGSLEDIHTATYLNVILTNYSLNGGIDPVSSTESISFAFTNVEYCTVEFDKFGTPGRSECTQFDLPTGVSTSSAKQTTTARDATQKTRNLLPGFEFTDNGGLKFPDGTIQTTAYTTGNGTAASTPGIYVIMDDIPDTIKVLSINDNIIRGVDMTSGNIQDRSGLSPRWSFVTFAKPLDHISTSLKQKKLSKTILNGFKILFVEFVNGTPKITHEFGYSEATFYRFKYNGGSTLATSTESWSIAFTGVEYESKEYDQNGNFIGATVVNYDLFGSSN